MISERCSCNAKISLPAVSPSSPKGWEATMQALADWREHHRHDMSGNSGADAESGYPDNPPLIDETSSSHELAPRYPLGFTADPDYDE